MKQHKTTLQAALVGILLTIGFLVYAQDNVAPTPTDSKEVKAVLNDKSCASCSIGGSCEGCSSVKGTKRPQCRSYLDCNSEYCEDCVDGRCEEWCLAKNCESCGSNGKCVNNCNPEACESCKNGRCEYDCKQNEDCVDGRCAPRCISDEECSRPYCQACDQGHCSVRSLCDNFFRCEICRDGACQSRCNQGQFCDEQGSCLAIRQCVPPCNRWACNKCDLHTGRCEFQCSFDQCKVCDGRGFCQSRCPEGTGCDGQGNCVIPNSI